MAPPGVREASLKPLASAGPRGQGGRIRSRDPLGYFLASGWSWVEMGALCGEGSFQNIPTLTQYHSDLSKVRHCFYHRANKHLLSTHCMQVLFWALGTQ